MEQHQNPGEFQSQKALNEYWCIQYIRPYTGQIALYGVGSLLNRIFAGHEVSEVCRPDIV